MEKDLFIYAVARVRVKELALLNQSHLEELLSCKSAVECLQLLKDKGWGEAEEEHLEVFFNREYEKTWQFIKEVLKGYEPLRILLYEHDFHNLKTMIKQVYLGRTSFSNLLEPSIVDVKVMETAIKGQNFMALPSFMKDYAREAYDIQFHTGDSRLCDAVLDCGTLENIYQEGKASQDLFLKDYAELKIALSNIRMAVKGEHMSEKRDFLERALISCESLDKTKLIEVILEGKEKLYEYLKTTSYGESVEMLKQSFSDFEKWCNKRLMAFIRPQKSNAFTLAPVAAYVLARQNEINIVKFIVLAKQYSLKEEFIREKLGEMYV